MKLNKRQPQYVPSEKKIERFVLASQEITGISKKSPLTHRHLQLATWLSKSPVLMHPMLIHHGLYNGIEGRTAVGIRDSVRGGKEEEMPPGNQVRQLLDLWHEETEARIAELWESVDNEEKCFFARQRYFDFLCIEPFVEANGRISRLIFNHISGRLGLKWRVFRPEDVSNENAELLTYRDEVFWPDYQERRLQLVRKRQKQKNKKKK